MVLLHGAYMSIESMKPILDRLAEDRQVIALESQGHGRTADIDRPITYEQMADDVAAAMVDLGIQQADVFGYSMGGGTALQLAIRHPARVRRMVVVSASYETCAHPGVPGEAHGIGMAGPPEDLTHRRRLHDLPRIQDHDAIADPRDHGQIVCDVEDAAPDTVLQRPHEVEDARLAGDVEPRRRFVHDEHRRVAGDRHRDHGPLLLAARQLVRVAGHELVWLGQSHALQQLATPRARAVRRHSEAPLEQLPDLSADRQRWVERGRRILETIASSRPRSRCRSRNPSRPKSSSR